MRAPSITAHQWCFLQASCWVDLSGVVVRADEEGRAADAEDPIPTCEPWPSSSPIPWTECAVGKCWKLILQLAFILEERREWEGGPRRYFYAQNLCEGFQNCFRNAVLSLGGILMGCSALGSASKAPRPLRSWPTKPNPTPSGDCSLLRPQHCRLNEINTLEVLVSVTFCHADAF